MQIIPDNYYKYGFTVRSQKDHSAGDAIRDLGIFGGDGKNPPSWLIAQWDSGPCLWRERIESSPDTITDGETKTVRVGEDGSVSLHLDTRPYYAAKPDGAAVMGDYWPHLLLECPDFGYFAAEDAEKAYYSCAAGNAGKMILSFDIRMNRYEKFYNPKDWVEADQFLMYFYVHGKRSNDFVWFGLQLFDSRWQNNSAYCAIDGGKADASGSLIYSVGLTDVYENADGSLWKDGKPTADGKWIHIELDLSEHLKRMYDAGKARAYFSDKVVSAEDLYINGMNLGFETIGSFDTEFEIRKLSLVSEK